MQASALILWNASAAFGRLLARALPGLFALSLAMPALAFEARRSTEGDLVHWPTTASAPRFVVHGEMAPGSDALLRAADLAARAWSETSDGLHIAVAHEANEHFTPGWNQDAPEQNENSIAAADEGWDYEDDALAATLLTFSSSTGELLDADILLNSAEYDFAWLEARETAFARGPVDLLSVVMHELGHAIGLMHSEVPEATMFAFLDLGETWMADLEEDDREGARFLYPPAPARTPADSSAATAPPREGDPIIFTRKVGCSSGGHGSPANLLAIGLLLLLAGALRTRRIWPVLALGLASLASPAAAGPLAEIPPAIVRALERATSLQVVEVQTIDTRWEGQQIVSTVAALEIFCLAGPCERLASFEVFGGQVGDRVQALSSRPNPHPGDRLLIALPERQATSSPRALLIRPMRRDSSGQWRLMLRGRTPQLRLQTIVDRLAALRVPRVSPPERPPKTPPAH